MAGKKSNKLDPVAVKCTFTWPYLGRQNDLAEKYTLDCSNLSKEDAKMLKSMGMNVRKDKAPDDPEKKKKWVDRGYFIQAKNGTMPKVYGPDRNLLDIDTINKIANGSKGVVTIRPYEWTFGKKEGIGAGLGTIIVSKIVEYHGNDKSVDELADLLDEDDIDRDSFDGEATGSTNDADDDADLDGLEEEDSSTDDDDFDDDLPF